MLKIYVKLRNIRIIINCIWLVLKLIMVNYFGMFFLIFYDNWKIDILVLLKYIKYILIYSKWVIDINDILYSC